MHGHDSEFAGYEPGYQAFADRPGLSDSAGKWERLRLPDLHGARLLDIGCNEGYFCGRAMESGAAFACGIDQSEACIAEARRRFPGCAFVAMDWDDPWVGSVPGMGDYDVALLLSAIHYTDAPERLVAQLRAALRPGGLLLLECGIADGPGDRVRVERTHDTAWHFTERGLRALFADWSWEDQGPSVAQETDPVPRWVIALRAPAG